MRVDVALLPQLVAALHPDGVPPGVHAVVVDTLRFSSTVAAALRAGCDGVAPVAEVDDARAIAAATGALLGGERGGLPPEGFDLGNSPGDYGAAACAGRRVVLCTTNGSRAVGAAAGAGRVLTAALVNAEAAAASLARGGRDGPPDEVLVVCAGSRGEVAADDVAAAGCLAGSLALFGAAEPGDGARAALALFDAWKHDLLGLLRRSRSGRRLAAAGLEKDLEFCARVDTVPVVAELDSSGIFRAARP